MRIVLCLTSEAKDAAGPNREEGAYLNFLLGKGGFIEKVASKRGGLTEL